MPCFIAQSLPVQRGGSVRARDDREPSARRAAPRPRRATSAVPSLLWSSTSTMRERRIVLASSDVMLRAMLSASSRAGTMTATSAAVVERRDRRIVALAAEPEPRRARTKDKPRRRAQRLHSTRQSSAARHVRGRCPATQGPACAADAIAPELTRNCRLARQRQTAAFSRKLASEP